MFLPGSLTHRHLALLKSKFDPSLNHYRFTVEQIGLELPPFCCFDASRPKIVGTFHSIGTAHDPIFSNQQFHNNIRLNLRILQVGDIREALLLSKRQSHPCADAYPAVVAFRFYEVVSTRPARCCLAECRSRRKKKSYRKNSSYLQFQHSYLCNLQTQNFPATGFAGSE
jgi:hypothetical protein